MEDQGLTPDVVFEVLSNSRRRATLYVLRTRSDVGSVAELADQITAMENDVPVSEVTRRERKRVYVSLYQTHVPKLETVGLVEREDGELRPTARAHRIDRFLPDETSTPRLSEWVGAVSVGTIFSSVALAIIGVSMAVATRLGLAVLVLAVGLSALVQFEHRRRRTSSLPSELTAP